MSHKVYMHKEDPVGLKCCVKKIEMDYSPNFMHLNSTQGSYRKIKFSFTKQLTNTVKLGQLCWNSTVPVYVLFSLSGPRVSALMIEAIKEVQELILVVIN